MTRKIAIFAGVLCLFGGLFCGPVQAEPTIAFPKNFSSFWAGFDFNTGQTDDNMDGYQSLAVTHTGSAISGSATSNGVTLSVTAPAANITDRIRDRVTHGTSDLTAFNNRVSLTDPFRNMYRDFVFNNADVGTATGYDSVLRLNLDNLTAGQEYLVRVHGYDSGTGTGWSALFEGTDLGQCDINSTSLRHIFLNQPANPMAGYMDVTVTANAQGQIDLALGRITPAGVNGIAFFNGLEIMEKPAMTQLMKVDVKVAGSGTVEPTFQPLYFANNTSAQSQTFFSDSGIEVTVDSNGADARPRNRALSGDWGVSTMTDMYRSVIHPAGGVLNMELSGLTPGKLYELVVYSCDPGGGNNNNTYSQWYVVDGEGTETMFDNAQFHRSSAKSTDAHQLSVIFEAKDADMLIRGKGSIVTMNGFELHEMVVTPAAGDPITIARVDINSQYNSNATTSQGVSNRPIAGRFEELLMSVGTSEGTMTTSSGLTVTVNTGEVNNGRHRPKAGLGYEYNQQYYNENNLDVSMALMQDYAFARNGNALMLDLDGLTPGHEYELTIYSQDVEMNSGFTNWYMGDVPADLDDDIWFVSYYGEDAIAQANAENVDVTEYWSYTEKFIAESDFLRISGIGTGSNMAFLNGFELYDLGASGGGSAVPEPATWGMLLLGAGMGVLAVRRRKKQRNPIMKKFLAFVVLLFVGSSPLHADPATALPLNYSSIWAAFDVQASGADALAGYEPLTFTYSAGAVSGSASSNGVTLSVIAPASSITDRIRDRAATSKTALENNIGTSDQNSYYNLYRDFVFNNANSGGATAYTNAMQVSLTGLNAGADYIVRVHSYDGTGSNGNVSGIFTPISSGNYTGTSGSLLGIYRNINTLPTAGYIDLSLTADAAGAIDLAVAGIAGGSSSHTALFNGLEIIEKPKTTQLMKVDVKASTAGGTTGINYIPWTTTNGQRASSFCSDSGIDINLTSTINFGGANRGGPTDMLRSFSAISGAGSMEMEFTGLTAGDFYELVLYSGDFSNYSGAYSTWSIKDGEGNWTDFHQRYTYTGCTTDGMYKFSLFFEAEDTAMTLKATSTSGNHVFLSGLELYTQADPTFTRVDINSTNSSNNRPIAGLGEELLVTNGKGSVTTSTGITATVTGTADRHRGGTGNRYTQRYYNEQGAVNQQGDLLSEAMMRDFAFTTGTSSPITLELEGLTPGNTYELTIYSQDLDSNNGWTNWFIGDVSTDLDDIWFTSYFGSNAVNGMDDWSYTETFVADTPYFKLSGVAAGGTNSFAFLNGFDLRDMGNASAVPEPATWVMLLLGAGMGVLAVRRRKS